MADLDPTFYSAGIVLILASVYLLNYTRIFFHCKSPHLNFSSWSGKRGKPDFQEIQSDTFHHLDKDLLPKSYTKAWWTDEKQFQLEHRAIFSKARSQTLSYYFELTVLADLDTRNPYVKISEAWRLSHI
jgi:hypothetical protein